MLCKKWCIYSVLFVLQCGRLKVAHRAIYIYAIVLWLVNNNLELTCNYLKYFTTLIIWNIQKDSKYCIDSLAIRLQSKDLKTPYPKNRTTRFTGLASICDFWLVFTFLEENNLVVLVEFHESWNHFSKFNDLFDQVGQFLSSCQPQLLLRLKWKRTNIKFLYFL